MPDMNRSIRMTHPHLGDYGGIIRNMLELTGCEIISPPPITRRTLELGSKYAPDSVCVPFKYNLGNYLEAIELGANAVFASAGGCRLEYYSEVHQQILRDLGYDIPFYRLDPRDYYGVFRRLNPRLGRLEFFRVFSLVIKKIHLLDELDDLRRRRCGFETVEGSFDAFWSRFLAELEQVKTHRDLRRLARHSRKGIRTIEVNLPQQPFRVGIIGELFLIMESASNFGLERNLARMGIEVHRWVTVSTIMHHGTTGARTEKRHRRDARPWAKYHVGAHGTESIARVNQMIREGYDGAIHLKPFGCMPEINALPALHRMCKEHKFPLMTLSFDSHTAESGVATRLEAFFDMIASRRLGGLQCASAI